MDDLLFAIRSNISQLFRENVNLRKYCEENKSIYSDLLPRRDALFKHLWIFHSQRLYERNFQKYHSGAILSIEQHNRGFTFASNSMYLEQLHPWFVKLFKELKRNHALASQTIILFNSSPFIIQKLCFIFFSTLCSFSFDGSILYSVKLVQYILNFYAVRDAKCSCLKRRCFNIACGVLFDSSPAVQRYFQVILQGLHWRNSRFCAREENSLGATASIGDSPNWRNSNEKLCRYINNFIVTLKESITLFPKCYLLVLGQLRHQLSSKKHSKLYIHRISVEYLNLIFNRVLLNPELFGSFDKHHDCSPSFVKYLCTVSQKFIIHLWICETFYNKSLLRVKWILNLYT